jgi:hypothetical protein
MTKQQPTLYSTLVDFINTIPVGETYSSEDFRKALTHITDFTGQQNTHGGRWYRVRSYQSYLKRIGALQHVKRGVWQVVYHIPHWLNLGIVELLLGYTCNKAMYPERIRLDEKKAKMLKDWNDYKQARDWSRSTRDVIKVGDKVIVTHKTKEWKQDSQRNNSWVSEMNNLIGKTCTVKETDDRFPTEVVLEECIGGFGYPISSLIKPQPVESNNNTSNMKQGDRVIITHKVEIWNRYTGEEVAARSNSISTNSWVSDMDSVIGQEVEIERLLDNDNDPYKEFYIVGKNANGYSFPFSCAKPVTKEDTTAQETKRTWGVGTTFVHSSVWSEVLEETVYKIESIKKGYAQITWQGDNDLANRGVSYDITRVDDYFKEGKWVIKEKEKTTPKQETRYTDTDMTEDWQTKAQHKYKKGDKVLITHRHKDGEWYDTYGHKTSWPNEMDEWIGKVVTLDMENGGDWRMEETVYYFPTECMQPYTGEQGQARGQDRLAGFLAELEILIAKWK